MSRALTPGIGYRFKTNFNIIPEAGILWGWVVWGVELPDFSYSLGAYGKATLPLSSYFSTGMVYTILYEYNYTKKFNSKIALSLFYTF